MNKNACALRPPMGWNSYDYYDTNVTERDILSNSQFMADRLKPYGWEYIVVDIQWYAYHTATMRDQFQYIPFGRNEMDAYGRLLPCPEKFPSSVAGAGFRPLADRVHEMGLKFGIHIMRGIPREAAQNHLPVLGTNVTADMIADPSSICPWNPDMYGIRNCEEGQKYYDSLLELYAGWGVDFIKVDDICATGFGERTFERKHEVQMIHKAIEHCGRPIVLSLSPGPALVNESWHYQQYANMWRITDDFWDDWKALLDMFTRCEKWQDHVTQGCWPDCDMLPLGRIGKHFGQERDTHLTKDEQITMLTLWCVFGSPLMLGAELTLLDPWTLSLLQNEELLRLENGRFISRQILRDPDQCIWAAVDPQSGEYYIALFNLSEREQTLRADYEMCIRRFPDWYFREKALRMKDVWTGQWVCTENGYVTTDVKPHGAVLLHGIK